MKTLRDIQSRSYVAHVDDERNIGNGIIVTLAEGWCFKADPGCRVRGFDTVAETKSETTKKAVTRYPDQGCT